MNSGRSLRSEQRPFPASIVAHRHIKKHEGNSICVRAVFLALAARGWKNIQNFHPIESARRQGQALDQMKLRFCGGTDRLGERVNLGRGQGKGVIGAREGRGELKSQGGCMGCG